MAFFCINGPSVFILTHWITTKSFHKKHLNKLKDIDRDLGEKIEPCIFREKWVSTSTISNKTCTLWRFLSARIPQQYVPAAFIPKNVLLFDPGESRVEKKTDFQKLNESLITYFYNQKFSQIYDKSNSSGSSGFTHYFKVHSERNHSVQLRRRMYFFEEKKLYFHPRNTFLILKRRNA